MDARIMCNLYHCLDECTEHAYCDKHYQENLDEAYERGKKESYEEAKAEFQVIN